MTPSGERVIAWLQELADGLGMPENISVAVAAPGADFWAGHLPPAARAVQLMTGPATAGALDHQTFTAAQLPITVNESALAAGNGQLYLTWKQQNDGTAAVPSTTTVKLATLLPSGQFGAPPTDRAFEDIQAAVDGSGALIVAGQDSPPGTTNPAVSAAVVAPGATPGPAVRLTPPGIARQLDSLAVAPDGTALILPDRVRDATNKTLQVLGSFRPAGASFGAPLDVSGLQDGPQDGFESAAGAVTSGGRALAAWTAADHSGAPDARLHLSELDDTPPTFGMISVPAAATVGQRVQLSAAATDALSGAVTIAWDFGDGSQAARASVLKLFATPGSAVPCD